MVCRNPKRGESASDVIVSQSGIEAMTRTCPHKSRFGSQASYSRGVVPLNLIRTPGIARRRRLWEVSEALVGFASA